LNRFSMLKQRLSHDLDNDASELASL